MFISVPKTIECVLTAIAFAVMLCIAVYRQTGVLQTAGYSNKKYFKWLKKKGNLAFGRLVLLAMLCALSSAVISLCFSFTGEWSAVIGLAPFILFFAVYVVADKKTALRSEVSATPRLYRLYAVLALVCAVVSYIFVSLLNFADYVWGNGVFTCLRYCALSLLPVLLIPLLMLSNCIAKIYEVPHNKKFIKQAKVKLAASSIKVVAITGSYGKTSTKFILNGILSTKYRVLSTPRSHNTPIGIALAVNNNRLEDYDIFIAEMGARHIGDIAELCELCPPDISLITGRCGQHLETFGTFQNVVKAKGEILGYTKDRAVIADDCFDLFAENPVPKIRCGCVSDIHCSPDGVGFTLTLNGESRHAHSKLLGKHSAYNIGLAAEAAFVARAALEVLKTFGGRKIVVTPGLVELGVLEEEENALLGKDLVGFDLIILVGDTLVTAVKRGYVDGGGEEEKLIIKPNLAEAQEELKNFIQPDDTVLFLNDLPDVY